MDQGWSPVHGLPGRPRTRLSRGGAAPGTASPFAAAQLRGGLAGLAAGLSRGRRTAATVPLLVALLCWFVVPGSAADFRLDASGDRYGTISHGIGGRDSYPIHIPGFNNENAGTLLMHQLPGGDVEAYCIDLHGVRNPGATFTSGERRIDQIAYILNHHFPVAHEAGALSDANLEAAAVQLAVWTFSDGINLAGVSAPSVPNFAAVTARARQIAEGAAANWAGWSAQQSAQPHVALRAGLPAVAPGQAPLTATVTGGPGGGIPDGTPIIFTVTSTTGTVDGRRTETATLRGGSTTVQIGSTAPAMVTVKAQVTVNGLAYLQLNPSIRPNQTLILASQLPVSGEASESATFTGAPQLTVTKSVAGAAASGTLVEARPGDTVRYTMSYTNTGSATATAASVRDDLAQGELGRLSRATLILEGGRERTMDRDSRVAGWSLGDIPPGGAGAVDVMARIPSSLIDDGRGVRFCNTATISAAGTPPVASNSACAHVTTTPHLMTVKVVDSGTATPGQSLHYTITVRNDGTRDLSAITVTDTLKGGNLDLLSSIRPSTGGLYDESTRAVTWPVAALAAGAATSVSLDATVPVLSLSSGETCLVNTATVGGGNSGGTYPSGPVTTCIHPPAPAIPTRPETAPAAKSPSPALPVAGSGPVAVDAPRQRAGPAAQLPVSATGERRRLRSGIVGTCLLVSGLVLVTGLRRRTQTVMKGR
ncbi:MAG: Cys-Gln thioester bond-forming surface protein [Candidatus Dormibacteria bacterium]